jgi:hypothetical protein
VRRFPLPLLAVLLLALLAAWPAAAQQAERRVALVVGNSKYVRAPLRLLRGGGPRGEEREQEDGE